MKVRPSMVQVQRGGPLPTYWMAHPKVSASCPIASGDTHVFVFTPSLSHHVPCSQVTFKNMRFLNGDSKGNTGGLFLIQGNVDITFINCEFGQSIGTEGLGFTEG